MAFGSARGGGSRNRRQPKPIPGGFWFGLFLLMAAAAWVFRLPPFAFVLAGIIVAGFTVVKPAPPKKDEQVDERAEKAWFRWKNMLSGLKPDKVWTQLWRVCWWVAWLLPLLLSSRCANPVIALVNVVCGFWSVMAIVHSLDRRVDYRHVYTGVSVGSFLKKASPAKKAVPILAFVLAGVTMFMLWSLDYVAGLIAIALPPLLFLLSVTFMDRRRQSAAWRDLVRYQRMIDGWIQAENSRMAKDWVNARVRQATTIGDPERPLIILRVAPQGGVSRALKSGAEAIRPSANEEGFNFCALLAAETRKQGKDSFDPNSARIVLAKDETSIPDITKRSAGEKLASLVGDIAYAQAAEAFGKMSPLTHAHDVSDDPEKAAWLYTFVVNPIGGETVERFSVDWLADETNTPANIIRLPVWADLFRCFHLAADPDTPLSDKGNKWRTPDVVTMRPEFQAYVETSQRWKTDHETWESILGTKTPAPSALYDSERTMATGDGWSVTTMDLQLEAPHTVSEYAALDLASLNPEATFVGMVENGDMGRLIVVTGGAPSRVDQIRGSENYYRLYAAAIVYKALLRAVGNRGGIHIRTCSQEGRDVAIWRIIVELDSGATVADIRSKAPLLESACGARRIVWDWKNANEAIMWMVADLYTDVASDLQHWRRPKRQKEMIQLALGDAWGIAGIQDRSGRAPAVIDMKVFPRNHKVLKARFQIPVGLSMANVESRLDRFLIASGYQYGRILPHGDEHGADLWDMALCKTSPFPEMVNADWDVVRQCSQLEFPLGVNDLGELISWDLKDTFHIAVMGKSGTGKSSAAMVVVADALLHGFDVVIIDPSKGANDFAGWAKPLVRAFVGEGQMYEAEAAVMWVMDEMSRRVQMLAQRKLSNINDLPEEERPKRLLVMFDEFNGYFNRRSKTLPNPNKDVTITNLNAETSALNNSINRTVSALAKIALQGRSSGISLLIGAQRLSMADLEPFNDGKSFYRTLGRMLLGMDSVQGVVSQGNVREANRLQHSMKGSDGDIPKGRGLWETMGGRLSAIQTWFAGSQSELAELFSDREPIQPVDLSPFMPQAVEQFTELSAEDLRRKLGSEEDEGEVISFSNPDGENDDDIEEVDW